MPATAPCRSCTRPAARRADLRASALVEQPGQGAGRAAVVRHPARSTTTTCDPDGDGPCRVPCARFTIGLTDLPGRRRPARDAGHPSSLTASYGVSPAAMGFRRQCRPARSAPAGSLAVALFRTLVRSPPRHPAAGLPTSCRCRRCCGRHGRPCRCSPRSASAGALACRRAFRAHPRLSRRPHLPWPVPRAPSATYIAGIVASTCSAACAGRGRWSHHLGCRQPPSLPRSIRRRCGGLVHRRARAADEAGGHAAAPRRSRAGGAISASRRAALGLRDQLPGPVRLHRHLRLRLTSCRAGPAFGIGMMMLGTVYFVFLPSVLSLPRRSPARSRGPHRHRGRLLLSIVCRLPLRACRSLLSARFSVVLLGLAACSSRSGPSLPRPPSPASSAAPPRPTGARRAGSISPSYFLGGPRGQRRARAVSSITSAGPPAWPASA